MDISYRDVENVLNVYSLEEIFEMNDVTTEDVLYFLACEEFLTLPNPRMVDLDD